MSMLQTILIQKIDEFFQQYKPLTYKKRDLILHANDTPLSVFYIKSGYVRVYRISEQGEELTLTILKPNDFFPLTYGINTVVNPYFLEAITPLTLWKAPQEQFIKFITTHADIYYELITRVLIRFDGVLSRMEYLVFSNAYTKVASTLLICAKQFGEQQGEDIILRVPLTHRDIATLIGITRETTSLEMKKLEKEGFLTRNGRLFVLKNRKELEQKMLLPTSTNSLIASSL